MIDVVIKEVTGNLSLVILGVLLFLVVYSLTKKRYNLPPGPNGVPILGYLPFIKNEELAAEALYLGKKYNSDIVSFKMGTKLTVALNTYELINDAFKKNGDQLADRAYNLSKVYFSNGLGVVHSDGQVWKEQRRHALSVLRDFGMGKIGAEKIILDEVAFMKEAITAHKGEAISPYCLLCNSISNIICTLMYGKRFEYDDKNFQLLITMIRKIAQSTSMWIILFPQLRYIPGNYFGFKDIKEGKDIITGQLEKDVQERIRDHDPQNISDYCGAFLVEMEKRRRENPEDNIFNEKQLVVLLQDIFMAGSETTSTTLRWGLGFMAKYPEVQKKVQAEIDENIGRDRLPTMKDKLNMPYTDAVVLEILRWGNLLPLGLPHANVSTDIKIRDYDIPKGSTVVANLYAVLREPKIWPYPNEFNPRNFISDSGTVHNQQYMIAFAIGKRACLGEALARMELFMFFTSIMQQFDILPEDAKRPPVMEQQPGKLIRSPKEYKVRFITRQ